MRHIPRALTAGRVDRHVAGRHRSAKQTGPLPLGSKVKYAAQIRDALDAAHKMNIIHRDLKPEHNTGKNGGAGRVVPLRLRSEYHCPLRSGHHRLRRDGIRGVIPVRSVALSPAPRLAALGAETIGIFRSQEDRNVSEPV